jgi:hypothetical protein
VTDQPLAREATSHAFEPEEQACAFSAEQAVARTAYAPSLLSAPASSKTPYCQGLPELTERIAKLDATSRL